MERHAVINDVDLLTGKAVDADDFLLHHPRIRDDALRAAFRKERLIESQRGGMLAIKQAAEFLQRSRDFVAPFQPRAMHTVTGAVNVATPDALEAEQNIAIP